MRKSTFKRLLTVALLLLGLVPLSACGCGPLGLNYCGGGYGGGYHGGDHGRGGYVGGGGGWNR